MEKIYISISFGSYLLGLCHVFLIEIDIFVSIKRGTCCVQSVPHFLYLMILNLTGEHVRGMLTDNG